MKTHREREKHRHRQREKQAPCREPDMVLDTGPPGSHPGLQAAPNCWATRAALGILILCDLAKSHKMRSILFVTKNILLANLCEKKVKKKRDYEKVVS